MTAPLAVTRVGDGVYRVDVGGRGQLVYVAGPAGQRWAFLNGDVFREQSVAELASRPSRGESHQSLTAPMPATVVKVLVEEGAQVKKGDLVLVLEAMKMELPIRAPADATVRAVRCRVGDLVQPETTLVELA